MEGVIHGVNTATETPPDDVRLDLRIARSLEVVAAGFGQPRRELSAQRAGHSDWEAA